MNEICVLTIAVPTFNMERWLDKNLRTYQDERLRGRLEVLCLNNASEDRSKEIILRYVDTYPDIFRLVDRDSRGYGSSINAAMAIAQGKYFRIVDADDWVDTEELVKLVDELVECEADVVLTDYQIVNMQDGSHVAVRAGDQGVPYGVVLTDFYWPTKTLPSIHATTYRTGLLRESGFFMQDGIFFVDEEYVILPYLSAKDVLYYPFDVYRYQVANPEQSTSPKNRGKYQDHREKVLRRLLTAYQETERIDPNNQALAYCYERIRRGVGDHFTTLYIYVKDRQEGRRLAKKWEKDVRQKSPEFWPLVRGKTKCLRLLNSLHIGLRQYEALKRVWYKTDEV